jgi:hypothetical protein
VNFVNDRVLHKLEQLSNALVPQSVSGAKSDEAVVSNMLLQYRVMRLFDQILKCRLMLTTSEGAGGMPAKSTSSLIYLVDNMFTLHDVFVGTPLASRMVARGKAILQHLAKRKQQLTEEQEEEVKDMLALPSLKGSELYSNVSGSLMVYCVV